MINLTNNQVIAFNRLFHLYHNYDTGFLIIQCKISIDVISIVIDFNRNLDFSAVNMSYKRYYYIRKNRIECKINPYGKKQKIYIYKLKKR